MHAKRPLLGSDRRALCGAVSRCGQAVRAPTSRPGGNRGEPASGANAAAAQTPPPGAARGRAPASRRRTPAPSRPRAGRRSGSAAHRASQALGRRSGPAARRLAPSHAVVSSRSDLPSLKAARAELGIRGSASGAPGQAPGLPSQLRPLAVGAPAGLSRLRRRGDSGARIPWGRGWACVVTSGDGVSGGAKWRRENGGAAWRQWRSRPRGRGLCAWPQQGLWRLRPLRAAVVRAQGVDNGLIWT